jgi:hypothetical protein
MALRARWRAVGNMFDDFPLRDRWADRLASPAQVADVISALIDMPAWEADVDWTDLVTRHSFDDISVALRDAEHPPDVDLSPIAASGASGWLVQYAFAPPLPGQSYEPFHWRVGRHGLQLNLVHRGAYFSDDHRRFRGAAHEQLPTLESKRVQLASPLVTAVGLVTREEDVTIALRESATHSIAESIETLLREESAIWRGPRVTDITVRTEDHRATITFDFRTSKVKSSRVVYLADMALAIGEYMADLTPAELTRLQEALRSR